MNEEGYMIYDILKEEVEEERLKKRLKEEVKEEAIEEEDTNANQLRSVERPNENVYVTSPCACLVQK